MLDEKEHFKDTELKMISAQDARIKMPKIGLPKSFVAPAILAETPKGTTGSKRDDPRVHPSKQDYLLSISGISPDRDADAAANMNSFSKLSDVQQRELVEKEIDTATTDRLEEEKKSLQAQLKKLMDRKREIERTPKASSEDHKGFPVDRLQDFEVQVKNLVELESTKKNEISVKKQLLKERLVQKHEGLAALETQKQKILKKKDENHSLLLELDGKKSELVSATLGYNSEIENTLNTPEDFRLLRYFKESLSAAQPTKKREYCPVQVSLSTDNLPKGLINDQSDACLLRFKYLISKKKGIFYEDGNLKIALKWTAGSDKSIHFVMRFINDNIKKERISTVLLDDSQKFNFSVDKRVFEVEPKEHYDLEFQIGTPVLNELPVLQLKTKRGEYEELMVTNVSLPITANWYYPLLRVTHSQFVHYWDSGRGYLLQSEMREIDNAIFAGEAELLVLIENLVILPDVTHDVSQARRYGAMIQLAGGLAAMRITVSQWSYFFIELVSHKNDEYIGRQVMLAYLFALSKCLVD